MLIEQRLKQMELPSGQEAVAKFMLQKRCRIAEYTIREIAQETYTSNATVIRLAKKLGYEGFDDFKEDFLKEIQYLNTYFVQIDADIPFHAQDNDIQTVSKIGSLVKESVKDTLSLIHLDSLQKAIQLLKDSLNIHFIGEPTALLLGKVFQMDMYQLGRYVHIWDNIGSEGFLTNLLNPKDVVIIVSYSGKIQELPILVDTLKKKRIPIIAITSIGENELNKIADVTMFLTTRETLYHKIKGYSSQTSMKLLLDILYSCYFRLNYTNNMNNITNIY